MSTTVVSGAGRWIYIISTVSHSSASDPAPKMTFTNAVLESKGEVSIAEN